MRATSSVATPAAFVSGWRVGDGLDLHCWLKLDAGVEAILPSPHLMFSITERSFLARWFSTPLQTQQQAIKVMAGVLEVIYLGTRKIDKRSSSPVPHLPTANEQTPPVAERSVLSLGARSTHAAPSRSSSHRPTHRAVRARAETGRTQARRKTAIPGGTPIPPEIVDKLVKVGCSRGSARTRQGQAAYAYFNRRGRFYHQVGLDVISSRDKISSDHVEYTSRLRGLPRRRIRTTVLDILKRRFGLFLDEDENGARTTDHWELDVNAQRGSHGTAFQAATFRRHKAIIQLSIEKGADIDTPGVEFGNAL
ncbi:hypothetical protein PG991_008989 [Apiospora marii]|uniref:Uncharacterized protein n=1 Tax=Apiospora marii TaxID=335849 RepID=A0ABR1RJG3_9PEZI